MLIAAQLIHFNYISLESFLPHINPSLSILQNNYVKKYQAMHDYIKNALNDKIKFQINSYVEQNLSLNKSSNYFCDFKYIISKALNWEENQNKKNGDGHDLIYNYFIVLHSKI